jgi:hypothetical protein
MDRTGPGVDLVDRSATTSLYPSYSILEQEEGARFFTVEHLSNETSASSKTNWIDQKWRTR